MKIIVHTLYMMEKTLNPLWPSCPQLTILGQQPEKNQTIPTGVPSTRYMSSTSPNCQAHHKQNKSWTLSRPKEAEGDMMTINNLVPGWDSGTETDI